MLRKLSPLVVLALLCQYSYSESITPYYGYTGNAAINGNSWTMSDVFPSDVPGLDVQNIIYNYTINKEVQDSVDVHIQNENALGPGYIFRETDSWLPGSLGGTQINKVVPVIPNIPREAWGDGSIVTEGDGYVTDPTVVYTYKVDPCYDPQFDPSCPGYQTPMPTIVEVDPSTLYNVLDDEYVDLDQTVDTDLIKVDEENKLSEEELAEQEKEEKRDSAERLEKALAEAENSVMFANAFASAEVFKIMDLAVGMHTAYNKTINGGVYNDSIVIVDKELPTNKQGLRNGLAQQLLHQQMVDMQY